MVRRGPGLFPILRNPIWCGGGYLLCNEPFEIVFDQGSEDEWRESKNNRVCEAIARHGCWWAAGNKDEGAACGMYGGF